MKRLSLKLIFSFAVFFNVAFTIPSAAQVALDQSRRTAITKAVETVSPAVVSIGVKQVVAGKRTYNPFFGVITTPNQEVESTGSGFIISEDGLVVTNQHVAGANASSIQVTLSDGSVHQAELIGSDELTDLSVLKIKNAGPFPFLDFGDSETVLVGEWAIAVGNPFGLFRDGQATVTVGVVSGTKRDFKPDPNDPRIYVDMIQTDAAINRGNSGGPLVNALGHVIGVNTFIFTGNTNSGFVGLGFAIPSNRVRKIVEQLINEGKVNLDYNLGMEFTTVTRELAIRYQLPLQGLLVVTLQKDGLAYKNGLLPGDIILSINGQRTLGEPYAWALLREQDIDKPLELIVYRNGQNLKATISLK